MTDTPTENLMLRPPGSFGKWTIERYVGKMRSSSPSGAKRVVDVWMCRCACGKRMEIQKGNLVNHLSSQCKACGHKSRSKGDRPHLGMWRRLQRQMCDAWLDEVEFGKFYANRNGRFLVRRDAEKPYSPENCFWSDVTRKGIAFRDRLVELRMRVLGETKEQADAWFDSVSKQRQHQWWDANCGDDGRRERWMARIKKTAVAYQKRRRERKAAV